MKENTIWDLMEIIRNDEKETYQGILNKQPYDMYMTMVLKAKYDLMQYAKDCRIIDFDVEEEKKRDKEVYEKLKWEE